MHRLQEYVRLARLGESDRSVVKKLGLGPNTVRKYREALKDAGLLEGPADALPELETLKAAIRGRIPPRRPPQQQSKLEAFIPLVEARLAKGVGPTALYHQLRLEHPDMPGSVGTFKRLCVKLKRAHGVDPNDVVIPVVTGPGEIAQVDFGEVAAQVDPATGGPRRTWAFVMVLGYSRRMFARLVFDQKVETFQALHVAAFEHFQGVVQTVVPDNLKAAVIRAAFDVRTTPALNRSYVELARHYGFQVDPTPAYAPKKKGKVESGVKYVKSSFMKGQDFQDVEEANRRLTRWIGDVADQRRHPSLGTSPSLAFEAERGALRPLPERRFMPVVWKEVTVHRDAHVEFGGCLYSVPFRHIGQRLWVRAIGSSLEIWVDDVRLHTHDRTGTGRYVTHPGHLPTARADLAQRSPSFWRERAAKMGPEVAAFVDEVLGSDDVLSQLRTVQGMVRLLEAVPPERARAACRRASRFGNFSYTGLKQILARGLDLEQPGDDVREALVKGAVPYRYARTVGELLAPLEVSHESN